MSDTGPQRSADPTDASGASNAAPEVSNAAPEASIAYMEGAEALPRRNGELVFHHDWERRAFALAVAMCEDGHYPWDDFRDHLIAAIAASGEAPEDPDPRAPGYFEHWLESLERLLAAKELVDGAADDPDRERS